METALGHFGLVKPAIGQALIKNVIGGQIVVIKYQARGAVA